KADAGLTRGTQKPAQVERWTIAENWAAADRARSTANVALAVPARFAPAVAPAKRFAFARLAAAAPARPVVRGRGAVRPPGSDRRWFAAAGCVGWPGFVLGMFVLGLGFGLGLPVPVTEGGGFGPATTASLLSGCSGGGW